MPDSLFRLSRFTLAGLGSTFVLVLGGLFAFGDPLAFGASTPQCTLTGTPGNDVLNGTSKADVICGLGGDALINGRAGNDTVFGGDGNDLIDGGAGNDKIDGGAGTDTVTFSDSSSAITASLATGKATGAGTDTLTADENLTGGKGNDTLTGDANANTLAGGLGNDKLNGGAGFDTVNYSAATSSVAINLTTGKATGQGTDGLIGDENAVGGSGNDTLTGGAGDNTLTGGPGNDTILGDAGSDALNGGDGSDSLNGGDGNDTVDYSRSTGDVQVNLGAGTSTGQGTDSLSGDENATGGPGNDTIIGDRDTNRIAGGPGDDYIDAGPGGDAVTGGAGNDKILGGPGADDLNGEAGTNVCDPDPTDIAVSFCPFDSTAPTVISVSLSTSTIDTSTGAQTVEVTARITDDLTGVANTLLVSFVSSGSEGRGGGLFRISGNARDGIYRGSVVFPAGTRKSRFDGSIDTRDTVGNEAVYWKRDSAGNLIDSSGNALGQLTISQVGEGDSTPPVLQSVSLSTRTIDTGSSSQTVKVRARISDDLSGTWDFYNFACARSEWDALNMTRGGWHTRINRASGTDKDGVFEGTVEFPQNLPKGQLRCGIELGDRAGNLSAPSEPSSAIRDAMTISQVGEGDSTPPMLQSVSLSTNTIDTSMGDQSVAVTARITDDSSGTKFVNVKWGGYDQLRTELSLVSGDNRDGTYRGSIVFPAGWPKGQTSGVLWVGDNVENWVWYRQIDTSGNLLDARWPLDGQSKGDIPLGPFTLENG